MDEHKRRTVESYDRNAVQYASKFKNLFELHQRDKFGKFISLLPGRKVLDLGCGAGDHAAFFRGQGMEVLCVDLSEEMILLCREKGLDAQVMDIEELSLPEGSFDGIWAVTSLLHVPKERISAVVRSLHSILRHGGILYICMKEGDGERYVVEKDGSQRFFAFWREEDLLELFCQMFEAIEHRKMQVGSSEFIQMFFRKPVIE